jgi:hypothetical protein
MIETISIIEIGVNKFWWWRRSFKSSSEKGKVGQVLFYDDAYEKALVNDLKLLKEVKKKQKGKVYWWTWWWINWVRILKKKIMTFIIGVFQSSILIIID